MRALVVDDQAAVLEGMLKGVEWKETGLAGADGAKSCAEAKQRFTEYHYELLICDIEMPGENGFDLIRWIQKCYPQTLCIIASSHDSFSNAKESIQLRCFEFIVQPASYREITDVVRRAVMVIRRSERQARISHVMDRLGLTEQSLEDRILRDLAEIDSDAERLRKNIEGLNLLGRVVEEQTLVLPVLIPIHGGNMTGEWPAGLIRGTIGNVLSELAEGLQLTVSVCMPARDRLLAILYPVIPGDEQSREIEDTLRNLIGYIRQYFSTNISCYIRECCTFAEMADQVAALNRVADNSIVNYGEFRRCSVGTENRAGSSHETFLFDRWKLLLAQKHFSIVLREARRQLYTLSKSEEGFSAEQRILFHQKYSELFFGALYELGISAGDIFDEDYSYYRYMNCFHDLPSLEEGIAYTLEKLEKTRQRDVDERDEVERARIFITRHIEDPLTVPEVAEYVGLNSEYLSRQFRHKTGMSLKDYVIEEKMNVAKELLEKTNLPVSVIASRVGYTNFSYFSQVFRSKTGQTPGDYRKNERERM